MLDSTEAIGLSFSGESVVDFPKVLSHARMGAGDGKGAFWRNLALTEQQQQQQQQQQQVYLYPVVNFSFTVLIVGSLAQNILQCKPHPPPMRFIMNTAL